jgi:hypothetical protein
VTIRAIGDESLDKPFISRHCLQAVNSLDDPQLQLLSQRKPVELTEINTELVRRCFADHDDIEQEKFFRKLNDSDRAMLLPKGAALLAQRVNYTLVKDGLIASLLKYRIANKALVTSELHARLCEYDRPIVLRLSKLSIADVPRKYLFNEGDTLLWLVSSDFCAKRSDEAAKTGG